jgi:hypothetical protein
MPAESLRDIAINQPTKPNDVLFLAQHPDYGTLFVFGKNRDAARCQASAEWKIVQMRDEHRITLSVAETTPSGGWLL